MDMLSTKSRWTDLILHVLNWVITHIVNKRDSRAEAKQICWGCQNQKFCNCWSEKIRKIQLWDKIARMMRKFTNWAPGILPVVQLSTRREYWGNELPPMPAVAVAWNGGWSYSSLVSCYRQLCFLWFINIIIFMFSLDMYVNTKVKAKLSEITYMTFEICSLMSKVE